MLHIGGSPCCCSRPSPHIVEELWSLLGHGDSLAYVTWPGFDPELARDEQRVYAVQLNGKVRHKVLADPDLDSAVLLETVKADRIHPVGTAGCEYGTGGSGICAFPVLVFWSIDGSGFTGLRTSDAEHADGSAYID
jgi:hypothetical protein